VIESVSVMRGFLVAALVFAVLALIIAGLIVFAAHHPRTDSLFTLAAVVSAAYLVIQLAREH